MKLFEYWTELPSILSSLYPNISPNLIKFSQVINQNSKKILLAQEKLISLISKFEINRMKVEQQIIISQKLESIESEKTQLIIQSVNCTVKSFNEAFKVFESVQSPSKEVFAQLKHTLQLTRSIKAKITLEQSNLSVNNSQANSNSNYYQLNDNNNYSKSNNKENSLYNESNCSIDLETQCSLTNDGVDNYDYSGEIPNTQEFLETFSLYIDKLQSKLFLLSNELLGKQNNFICSRLNLQNKNLEIIKATNKIHSDTIISML